MLLCRQGGMDAPHILDRLSANSLYYLLAHSVLDVNKYIAARMVPTLFHIVDTPTQSMLDR